MTRRGGNRHGREFLLKKQLFCSFCGFFVCVSHDLEIWFVRCAAARGAGGRFC